MYVIFKTFEVFEFIKDESVSVTLVVMEDESYPAAVLFVTKLSEIV